MIYTLCKSRLVMSKVESTAPWREARRRSARDAILATAWALVQDEGLAGLSLRELAKRAGITTPTVYAYFDSKNAIYDAMFGEAASDFADVMTRPYGTDDPREIVTTGVRRFVEFCTENVPRYQLLFQRTIPGFEPSAESYAHSVRAYEHLVWRLSINNITDPRQIDRWTAWTTGLVDQQISNDPGGERWSRLIDEFVEMYLAYARTRGTSAARKRNPSTKKGRR